MLEKKYFQRNATTKSHILQICKIIPMGWGEGQGGGFKRTLIECSINFKIKIQNYSQCFRHFL